MDGRISGQLAGLGLEDSTLRGRALGGATPNSGTTRTQPSEPSLHPGEVEI